MPIKLYDPGRFRTEQRKSRTGTRREDEPAILQGLQEQYRTNDKEALKYLQNHDPCLPHTVNTVHLQNPYRHPQRFEGYNLQINNTKNMQRSRESTLRSRHNKGLFARRDPVTGQIFHRDDDDDDDDKDFREDPRSGGIEIGGCMNATEISATARQYCINSTLHGLRYVGDSGLSIVERAFWIISFSVAVLTASYYIWFLYGKWVAAPIIISLSPESVSLNEFPFPSVTVCNMNNARRSEALRIREGRDGRKKLLLDDVCNFENNSMTFDLDETAITWNSMLHFMINVSQPCTDMLYYCQWRGNQTECEKIFNPTMTDEGICCNFNSVHRKHLFYNPSDWSDLNITFPFSSIDWNPETGYEQAVPPDAIPWRPYGAGQFYGLTLVLDAAVEEYYCSSTASVGFKMLLHNPVETPKIADFAFSVTPGEETRVIVSPRISTASKSIVSVPQRKRKCFFTSERKLRYYRTYTQKNCVLECEANFTQKICHCVQYYMPKSSNTPICEKKDDLCATKARRAMEVKLYDDESSIASLNVTETPSCNCWPGCFEINYNVEISQSKLLPSFKIADHYVKGDNDYFTRNMAVVHLFFIESQFTKYAKTELFGFTEFLSSTGGLLGLFMGFSFLSVMEIIYFATLRLWCRTRRNKASQTKQEDAGPVLVQPVDRTRNIVYPFAQ